MIPSTPAPAGVAKLLNRIPVEKRGVAPLGFPLIDQRGDEVAAGFNREDKSLLERAGQPQVSKAELRASLVSLPVPDDVLADVFHVMDVHPHVMTEAMWKEEGMGAGRHGFVRVALHQAKRSEVGDE